MSSSFSLSPPTGRSDKLLLALASTVILSSGSRETHDHIFLSHDSGNRAILPPCCLCVPLNFLFSMQSE
jgi:hypothetical protein